MSKKATIGIAAITVAVAFIILIRAIQLRLDNLFPRPDHWLGTTVAEQFIILLIHDHLTQGVFVLGIVLLAGLAYRFRRQLDESVGL